MSGFFCSRHSVMKSAWCWVWKLLPLTGTGGKPLSEAEVYDPASNTWTSLPSMSVPLASCSFTASDDRLYVIGGLTVGGPSASLQQLSLKWSVTSQLDSIISSSSRLCSFACVCVWCLWCAVCIWSLDLVDCAWNSVWLKLMPTTLLD